MEEVKAQQQIYAIAHMEAPTPLSENASTWAGFAIANSWDLYAVAS